MKGLQIDFQLKRQTKIGKIMNYLLVLAVFIIAMTFCVYVPYVGLQKEKNEAMLQYADTKNEYNQLVNENNDKVVNDENAKKFKNDYEILCASLGTTKIVFNVDGNEIIFDGLDKEVGYYTSNQDKILYILDAVSEFNKFYKRSDIEAKIEYIKFDSLTKTVATKIIFDVNSASVTDFRAHMKNIYFSNEYIPFVSRVVSQSDTTGIDEGLELTLFYE